MKYPLFACCLLFFSCSYIEEDTAPDTDSLDYYLEQFEREAAKRNLSIHLQNLNLITRISEIDDEGVAGLCHYSSTRPNQIIIDKSFWSSASSMIREMVVFHELGHCVLGRGHRESHYSDGRCVSIMQSGLGSCYLLYNDVHRDAYINELFFPGDY